MNEHNAKNRNFNLTNGGSTPLIEGVPPEIDVDPQIENIKQKQHHDDRCRFQRRYDQSESLELFGNMTFLTPLHLKLGSLLVML